MGGEEKVNERYVSFIVFNNGNPSCLLFGFCEQLVFQTGQLQQLQNQLNATTLSLVQSPPHRTLVSPVLLNSLPSTSPISPSLLLSPLQHRQAQLLAPGGPLSYLHLRAQRAVLGSYVGAASSVGLGYAGWLEGLWEVGSGAGLVGLGVLAGVRWGQGRWAKAIKKFWIDWKRVEDGLEVDLKVRRVFVFFSFFLLVAWCLGRLMATDQ